MRFIAVTLLTFFSIVAGGDAACTTFNTCDELANALQSSTTGVIDVCASASPIVCDETMSAIYLNDPSNPPFELNCIASDNSCGRCLVDMAPTSSYDGSSAYGGFILQKENQLTVDGFEFFNFRGSGQIFYNQEGSTLTIRNSVFTNNIYTGAGKNPFLVYDFANGSATLATTTIENSLFKGNKGSLVGFQAGNAVLRNNIFFENSLPEGSEAQFSSTSFIFWEPPTDAATFVVEGNHFHSFEAPASSGTHDKFFMISTSSSDVDTSVQFSGVSDDNCAANNNVAGNYPNSGLTPNGAIYDCNDGIYGHGGWPNRECMAFAGGTCSDYGSAGPPMPCASLSASRKYFAFNNDKKALDFVPDSGSIPLIDQTPISPASLTIFEGVDRRSHYSVYNDYSGVPPYVSAEGNSECTPPSDEVDLDGTWPGLGCTCFVPGFPEVSYFDMVDQVDPNNAASGYKTAFDTSVTGGVTVAGWFKAGDTSGAPWNAQASHPGQQTSLIFVRGEKASWKSGYNLGMGNWNSFGFEVILRGPNDDRYSLRVGSPTNAYPGIDVWHHVVGVYNAELGRASLYVDNQLVQSKSVPLSWERWQKDIQWKGSDSELSKTRIGNGYDANDKNFHGCTGGFAVYGEAIEVSDTPAGSNRQESSSGSKGDPHFKTWKNEHFEYHGQCDMVLARDPLFAGGIGLEVQIRTKIVRFWSYIKTVSIRIGHDILEVEGSPDQDDHETHYWFNFEYQRETDSIGSFPVSMTKRGNQKRFFEIDLGSKFPGQKIVISTFREFVAVDFKGSTVQSFGNAVGMLGDFQTGKTLARDGVTELHDFSEFGQEWQVLPSEDMLFHDVSEPQFPQRCILPEDPRGVRRRRLLDESSVTEAQAEAACASISDKRDRKDCVYDILATQDLDMVGAY